MDKKHNEFLVINQMAISVKMYGLANASLERKVQVVYLINTALFLVALVILLTSNLTVTQDAILLFSMIPYFYILSTFFNTSETLAPDFGDWESLHHDYLYSDECSTKVMANLTTAIDAMEKGNEARYIAFEMAKRAFYVQSIVLFAFKVSTFFVA